jgi:hypothetical protein
MADDNPSTPEMVERVARALCRADGNPGKPETEIDIIWHAWINPARAAIAAMREPTEAMVAVIAAGCGATPECEFDCALARDRIRAMIDAALGE